MVGYANAAQAAASGVGFSTGNAPSGSTGGSGGVSGAAPPPQEPAKSVSENIVGKESTFFTVWQQGAKFPTHVSAQVLAFDVASGKGSYIASPQQKGAAFDVMGGEAQYSQKLNQEFIAASQPQQNMLPSQRAQQDIWLTQGGERRPAPYAQRSIFIDIDTEVRGGSFSQRARGEYNTSVNPFEIRGVTHKTESVPIWTVPKDIISAKGSLEADYSSGFRIQKNFARGGELFSVSGADAFGHTYRSSVQSPFSELTYTVKAEKGQSIFGLAPNPKPITTDVLKETRVSTPQAQMASNPYEQIYMDYNKKYGQEGSLVVDLGINFLGWASGKNQKQTLEQKLRNPSNIGVNVPESMKREHSDAERFFVTGDQLLVGGTVTALALVHSPIAAKSYLEKPSKKGFSEMSTTFRYALEFPSELVAVGAAAKVIEVGGSAVASNLGKTQLATNVGKMLPVRGLIKTVGVQPAIKAATSMPAAFSYLTAGEELYKTGSTEKALYRGAGTYVLFKGFEFTAGKVVDAGTTSKEYYSGGGGFGGSVQRSVVNFFGKAELKTNKNEIATSYIKALEEGNMREFQKSISEGSKIGKAISSDQPSYIPRREQISYTWTRYEFTDSGFSKPPRTIIEVKTPFTREVQGEYMANPNKERFASMNEVTDQVNAYMKANPEKIKALQEQAKKPYLTEAIVGKISEFHTDLGFKVDTATRNFFEKVIPKERAEREAPFSSVSSSSNAIVSEKDISKYNKMFSGGNRKLTVDVGDFRKAQDIFRASNPSKVNYIDVGGSEDVYGYKTSGQRQDLRTTRLEKTINRPSFVPNLRQSEKQSSAQNLIMGNLTSSMFTSKLGQKTGEKTGQKVTQKTAQRLTMKLNQRTTQLTVQRTSSIITPRVLEITTTKTTPRITEKLNQRLNMQSIFGAGVSGGKGKKFKIKGKLLDTLSAELKMR